jgi:hypothetical protein
MNDHAGSVTAVGMSRFADGSSEYLLVASGSADKRIVVNLHPTAGKKCKRLTSSIFSNSGMIQNQA